MSTENKWYANLWIIKLLSSTLKVDKKIKLKWKIVKNAKKWAITDLNAPNDSRDIPFQSQEFGQDEYRHFVGFQPHLQ